MLPTAQFLGSSFLFIACVTSLALAGRAFQLRYLTEWTGPAMLTARASASFSLVLMISYLLGAFGAFSLAPLAIGFLVTGPLGQFILKPPSSSQAQEIDFPARLGIPLAVGGMALISVWMLSVRFALWEGITGTDSLWYHMPFAVHFYQSESLMGFDFAEPLFQTYFYPSSGSLFHALGMVFFDRDFLTPLVNLGWLGFAILAGAAIGSERKVAATSALGVAAVFAGEGVLRGSAGSAMVDTPATFFFLAAVLLMIKRPQTRAALLLSGLAVGAGVSVKLTIIAPAALLGIAVVVLAAKGERIRSGLIWSAGAFGTGGFWFIRNWVGSGSPLPLLNLPFFPYPGKALQSGTMKPITAYLGDTSVLFHQLPHAWIQALGPTALVVLAVGGLASVAILIRPPGGEARWRAAALVALGSMVTYAMTPGTAAGPPGGPLRGLFMDTRFIAPGLCLALILAPMLVSHLSVKARDLAALPMAFFVVSAASKNNSWGLVHPRIPMLTAASVILIGTGITTWYPGSSRRARSAAIVMALLILVPAGSIYEHSFAAGAVNGHGPALATTGPARVGVTGISGTFAQYLQVGESLQNEVSYVGIKGPHGALRPPRTCQEMKAEINRAGYTWIVASPNRSIWKQRTFPDLEQRWLAADPNAKFVRNIRGLEHNLPASGSGPPDPFLVYRLVGPLSGASCPK